MDGKSISERKERKQFGQDTHREEAEAEVEAREREAHSILSPVLVRLVSLAVAD